MKNNEIENTSLDLNEDCNLTIEQIHEEQAKMTKIICDYFDKNNLTYFLCGGTLLRSNKT